MNNDTKLLLVLLVVAFGIILILFGFYYLDNNSANNTTVANNTTDDNVTIVGSRQIDNSSNTYEVLYSNGYVRRFTDNQLVMSYWQDNYTRNDSFSLYVSDQNTLNNSNG